MRDKPKFEKKQKKYKPKFKYKIKKTQNKNLLTRGDKRPQRMMLALSRLTQFSQSAWTGSLKRQTPSAPGQMSPV